jgi:peptide/nickel transport system permease protein
MPPSWCEGGSEEFLLGTDHVGRDVLSRIIYGSRISLAVSLSAVGLSAILGLTLGLIAGFSGGLIDGLISRVIDVQLAVPYMLIAVTVTMVLEPSLPTIIGVLVLSGWVRFARLVRGQALSIKQNEFVLAARAVGASSLRIVLRHILPNVVNIIIVISTLQMASTILFESSLSFLGLGVPPPAPSWGTMLSDGRNYVASAWWLVTFPGIAISVTTLAINEVGDWLMDTLDPRSRGEVRGVA